MPSRRGFLLASVSAGLLAGCGTETTMVARPAPAIAGRPEAPKGPPVIDVHCHIFNGSDLAIGGYTTAYMTENLSPLLRFLRPVAYAAQTFYANFSMGPAGERALLSTTRPGERLHEVFYRQTRSAQHLSDFAVNTGYNWGLTPARGREPNATTLPSVTPPEGDDWKAFLGYMAKPRSTLALMLAELTRRGAGRDGPVLLTPALVDMWNWVNSHDTVAGWLLSQVTRQTLDRANGAFEGATGLAARTSTVDEQMAVMELLSERHPDGLLVHPFVPYDPWRGAVDLAAGRVDEALRWVRNAVLRQGAIGVKLYPPMGFRATGNAELDGRQRTKDPGQPVLADGGLPQFPQEYRRAIRQAMGGEDHPTKGPGYWLDQALDGLYRWCDINGVALMAHTGPSHSSNGEPEYLCRAEPMFWRQVLTDHPTLRINMGHFGGIWRLGDAPDKPEDFACTAHGAHDVQAKWLTQIRDILTDEKFAGRAFADIADVPMPPGSPATHRFLAGFRRFTDDIPEDIRAKRPLSSSLMYGSDFPFTVLENASLGYRFSVEAALRMPDGLGLAEAAVEQVMWRNAARFLGLTRNAAGIPSPAAARLLQFHADAFREHGTPDQVKDPKGEAARLLCPFLVEEASSVHGVCVNGFTTRPG